jgi:hypothetical protein
MPYKSLKSDIKPRVVKAQKLITLSYIIKKWNYAEMSAILEWAVTVADRPTEKFVRSYTIFGV